MKNDYVYKKVGYLGIPGSNTYLAGKKYFGEKSDMTALDTVKDIFEKVKNDSFYGVVPVENSTTGSIFDTFDSLLNTDVSIIGEIVLHIHHNILSKSKSINTINKCFSHPQAIQQCTSFFRSHSTIKPFFTKDTASAAQQVSLSNKDESAIGNREAARIYGLNILEVNVEDNPNNYTRFAVIGNDPNKTGDKVTLSFSVEHKPGSLFATLSPYCRFGLNLTKIESRPVFGKPWEYIFIVDLEIPGKFKEFAKVLEEMKENVNFLKILGIYRKGVVYES